MTNVDFARTLLEAAGVPAHERMQGRSFWGDLTGNDPAPAAEGLYYRYWEHDDVNHHAPAHYGFRSGHHKLIYFYNDGLGIPGSSDRTYPPEWELYDLSVDPDELNNVADDPAYHDVRQDLEARMWLAQRAVGDEPHPSQAVPALLADSGTGRS